MRSAAARWGESKGRNMTTHDVASGGYRYLEGVFQYSGGVRAIDGYHIERVRFRESPPIAEGFERIEKYLAGRGLPRTSFCACELRSPTQFTEAGFRTFNEGYVKTLERWGLFANGLNPVARSNVCPEIYPPATPIFHAFSYARPGKTLAPNFVIAGSGEVSERGSNYRDHIVAYGDTSPAGMRQKARCVLDEMERRLEALGLGWKDTTDTQVYTVFDVHSYLADDLVRRGAASHGITWQFCRPPIIGLEFEMDCRGIESEHML
jgi:hypothetical protein